MIQFTAVNNNGGLHIRLVDRVSFGPEAEDVFDDELAVASVGAHFLLSSTPLYCTRLRLFTNNESVPGESIFRAAEFTFGDSYSVFFDPLWIDGIRLSTGIPELWLAEENSPRNQSSFGPLEETEWLPTRLRPEASR